ncbi:ATP-binding protein [Aristaeella lactis]|uniref:Anti-sigma regulatory factor (Ser/Thr protein kinase) n=1 Tax=Aristaeella lactis TaxID=3046383 RepID=A0AC61PHN3_9FIRM|nr:ATP-binding protein [Aristaeella lactis]QUA53512.1 ATP-binding protein [Aristaeella lactis]SMC36352.1 Anti-sigma regulatory factor (Ser/Thr protein kinase) [Aristaeella lactis]
MADLTVDALVSNLDQVLAFVDGQLETMDCSMKAQMQIDVAVEEIYVNIANYAYAPETGKAYISVRPDPENASVTIEFRDNGIPFDPLAKADPDVTLSAEERKIGGLGIYMVKKSMDAMEYSRKDGQNILTITKKL